MKKFIFTFTAFSLLTASMAHAGQTCYPPLSVQAEVVSVQIAQKIVDKFCDQKQPTGKTGDIIIYYERDSKGQCIAKVKVVK